MQKPIARCDADKDEKRPLRSAINAQSFDLAALRTKVNAREEINEYAVLEVENNPEYCVLLSIANAVFAVMIVLGAYWFVIAAGDKVTPKCKPYGRPDLPIYSLSKDKLYENLCYSTTYCFWTYPIWLPLAVIWVNWKNLIDKRIFYECLMNRIFLVQSRVSFLTSAGFWFLIVYGVLAVGAVHFMKIGKGQHDGNTYWKYRELVFGMLAYFTAVAAFLYKLFSQWSVNNQIISLSNFAYQDSTAAVDLINSCTFVDVADFEASWERVEELFDELKTKERITPELNTAELLQLTFEMHEKWKEHEPSAMEQMRECCGHCFFPKKYWVNRFLYFAHLADVRSWHFKFCIRFYKAFLCISVILWAWGMFYTTSQYLMFQNPGVMPEHADYIPAPHEAPAVVNQASKLIPYLMK